MNNSFSKAMDIRAFYLAYIEYVEDLDDTLISGISYTRATGLNLLVKYDDSVKSVSTSDLSMGVIPKELDTEDFMDEAFDLLEGQLPTEVTDLVLVVDNKNRVDTKILKTLGVSYDEDKIDFSEIIGKEIKLVFNNDYYTSFRGMYIPNIDYEEMYESENNLTLKIVGIVRAKENNYLGQIATSVNSLTNMTDAKSMMSTTNIGNILYRNDLVEKVISVNSSSDIVEAQEKLDVNIMTGEVLNEEDKHNMMVYLGSEDDPYLISIYPKDFASKDIIIEYLSSHHKLDYDFDERDY